MNMSMSMSTSMSMSMDECLDLPPGFRFHPTDEELITSYLSPKVADLAFTATAIGEVDLNKCEPWDLPSKAKMGEKEWYFFCQRDRKYPTGMRTNRATEAGYWKATGKDKEIYVGKGRRPAALVGMKKTLVFYRGRAPKGDKSNWVMHEYRLESSSSSSNPSPKDEWVVCRVFHKSGNGGGGGGGAKKIPMPDGKDQYAALPPLMDYYRPPGSGNHYYNPENFEETTNATTTNLSPNSYFSSMMAGMDDLSDDMVNPAPISASALPPPPQPPFSFQDPYSSTGTAGPGYLHRRDYYYHMLAPPMRQCKAEQLANNNNHSVVLSEDTGVSTDRNTEISSVVSRHDVFEYDDMVSGAGAELGLDLDGIWRC